MANSQLLYQSYKIICDTTSKVAVKRTTIYLVVNTASKRMLGFMRWTPLESVGEKCATHNLKAWRKLVYVICQNNAYICTTLTALAAATEYFLRHEFKDHLNADEDNTAEVCNHSMSLCI